MVTLGAEGMSEHDVRLTVSEIDLMSQRPGEVLLDVTEAAPEAVARAVAWAHVRGYDRLSISMGRAFGGEPPESGFAAIINKPHQLLVTVTWPWAPDVRQKPTGARDE